MDDHASEAPAPPRGIDRRTVVRSAAWTVPVIAASAQVPAFAASCNQLYDGVLDLAASPPQYVQSTLRRGDATVPLSGAGGTIDIAFRSVFTNYTPNNNNLSVIAGPTGGINLPGLNFGYSFTDLTVSGDPANNETINITFTRSVYNLVFTITDIDNGGPDSKDAVAIEGAAFTYEANGLLPGSLVDGSGTVGDPFRTAGTANYDNRNDNMGNVRITMLGPVTTFSIRYWNRQVNPAASGGHAILLTRMRFKAYESGCL